MDKPLCSTPTLPLDFGSVHQSFRGMLATCVAGTRHHAGLVTPLNCSIHQQKPHLHDSSEEYVPARRPLRRGRGRLQDNAGFLEKTLHPETPNPEAKRHSASRFKLKGALGSQISPACKVNFPTKSSTPWLRLAKVCETRL